MPSNIDHLAFTVTATDAMTEDERPYVALKVVPTINGTPITCAAFDAAMVLAQQMDSGHFEPFTCSCGAAGCAGIHEDAYLCGGDHIIEWRFPESYFRETLPTVLTTGRQPLTFYFPRDGYEHALCELVTQLREWYQRAPAVDFAVGPYPREEDLMRSLDDLLVENRQYREQALAQHAHKVYIFGDKLDAEVRAAAPDGAEWSVGVYRLADHLAYTESKETGADRGAVLARIGQQLCADDQAVIEHVRGLGPARFMELCWNEKVSLALENADEETQIQYVMDNWSVLTWSMWKPVTLAG